MNERWVNNRTNTVDYEGYTLGTGAVQRNIAKQTVAKHIRDAVSVGIEQKGIGLDVHRYSMTWDRIDLRWQRKM
jgi:hypothetical protein